MDNILEDICLKLNIKIESIESYKDGATNSLVFSINNKYLIKTMNNSELKIQKEFFDYYLDNPFFQKIIYLNDKLNYICFKFIEGNKFKNINYDIKKIIDEIYNITKSYKKIDVDYYGYLDYKVKIPYEFLLSEIEYASSKIPNINKDKVYESLDIVKNYQIAKYLLHGDFGVHNFLFSNDKLKVIDPMPLVFDPLYDFYFAVLSSNFLFNDMDDIYKYYDRDLIYKKNLLLIVFYIRMSRAYVYDKEHFEDYLKIYKKL